MNEKSSGETYSIITPSPLLYLRMIRKWMKLYELIQEIDFVDKESGSLWIPRA